MNRDIEQAKGAPLLPREPEIEHALSWAAQRSYAFTRTALDAYCEARGLAWTDDPMYGYITFEVKS